MINRLLHAVRGVYPDMPDLVAGALADMFGRVLLPVLIDAQRFQFIAIAADDPDGPESLAMADVEPDAAFDALPPSGQIRLGLDMAMAAYGAPVPDVDAAARRARAEATADVDAERKALLIQLDVALNGAAGAAQSPSLCDLVAQVERQQRAVHIVNFDDGMVINFRAPDGRRATLDIANMIEESACNAHTHCDDRAVMRTMRDAIAAYPRVGPRVPVKS